MGLPLAQVIPCRVCCFQLPRSHGLDACGDQYVTKGTYLCQTLANKFSEIPAGRRSGSNTEYRENWLYAPTQQSDLLYTF